MTIHSDAGFAGSSSAQPEKRIGFALSVRQPRAIGVPLARSRLQRPPATIREPARGLGKGRAERLRVGLARAARGECDDDDGEGDEAKHRGAVVSRGGRNLQMPHNCGMPLPDELIAERQRVAARYLTGAGIEIGALDAPTPLPPGATARYVDFRHVAELHRQYPELDAGRFVNVDVVDDGERLASFGDASLGFLIANHMLEHCENPLGTLRNHARKVAPGGWLFYAMPDMRCCFDSVRPLTRFEHLVADDADGGGASRHAHYLEWAKLVNGIADDAAAEENARLNIARGYSIHYHVWDCNSWIDFLSKAREYLGSLYEIRHVELSGPEIISVLRRA